MDYPNSAYDIGFVVDQRIDEETQLFNAAKAKYPTCVKYNLNNINYKNCTIAQERSRKCFSEIEKKRFKKESEEKTICQRRSYIEFPDEYLQISDQKNKDIERTKNNSDFYFAHSFVCSNFNKKYITSYCNYGINFASTISHENIFGTQFHPEKSSKNGQIILKNFLDF